jgi:hypothetical protein
VASAGAKDDLVSVRREAFSIEKKGCFEKEALMYAKGVWYLTGDESVYAKPEWYLVGQKSMHAKCVFYLAGRKSVYA